ncbi:Fic family protein, partial [Paraburkholderia sp. SIMBA_050]
MTEWVLWFVEQVRVSCEEASSVVDATLAKAIFWMNHQDKVLAPRQRKVVNLLLDAGPNGFEGGMSTRKYESVGDTSR